MAAFPINGDEGGNYARIAETVRGDLIAARQGMAVYNAFDAVHDRLDDVCRSLVGAQARSRHGRYDIVAAEADCAISIIEDEVLPTLRNLRSKATRRHNKRSQAQALRANP